MENKNNELQIKNEGQEIKVKAEEVVAEESKIENSNNDKVAISKKTIKIVAAAVAVAVIIGGLGFGYAEYREHKREQKMMRKMQEVRTEQQADYDDDRSDDVRSDNSRSDNNTSVNNTSVNNSQTRTTQRSKLSDGAIKGIVSKHLNVSENSVNIIRVEQDRTDDYGLASDGSRKVVYDVKVSTEKGIYELDIDANSGRVLKAEIDD